jgi:hypothetical protein
VSGVIGAENVVARGLAVELGEVGDFFSGGEKGAEDAEEDEKTEDHEGSGADLVTAEEAQEDLTPTDAVAGCLRLGAGETPPSSGGGLGGERLGEVSRRLEHELVAPPRPANPRIEPAVEQIGDQIRGHDGYRDHQEDPL